MAGTASVALLVMSSAPTAAVGAEDRSATATLESNTLRLVLLGTAGGPGAMVDRAGIATLLTVGGKHYLIDAGEGVARQLARAGLSERDVHAVFLTHLHDDHTAGLGGLASFAFTLGTSRLDIMGPPDTERLIVGLRAFLQPNAQIRGAERPLPPLDERIVGRNLSIGVAYRDENMTVIAAENTHYNLRPGSDSGGAKSYSYRFEAAGKVIVFTGDTGPSAAVGKLALGADVLIAEMVTAKDIALVPPEVVPHMLHEHLTAAELGKLAQSAGVKKVVISHTRSATDADLVEIGKYYSGPVEIGQDLARY